MNVKNLKQDVKRIVVLETNTFGEQDVIFNIYKSIGSSRDQETSRNHLENNYSAIYYFERKKSPIKWIGITKQQLMLKKI